MASTANGFGTLLACHNEAAPLARMMRDKLRQPVNRSG
jgi:hypothetical protein